MKKITIIREASKRSHTKRILNTGTLLIDTIFIHWLRRHECFGVIFGHRLVQPSSNMSTYSYEYVAEFAYRQFRCENAIEATKKRIRIVDVCQNTFTWFSDSILFYAYVYYVRNAPRLEKFEFSVFRIFSRTIYRQLWLCVEIQRVGDALARVCQPFTCWRIYHFFVDSTKVFDRSLFTNITISCR